ncbi:MAG: group II intron reverse transcriptase/maturase [Clostridiales bacterium]|nr:group II intron reverse transcriptase/maturase [Clostridiales bacterium]
MDLLRECHKELDGKKAAGVDKAAKAEYEADLDENLKDLADRLKQKNCKPQPPLRAYIPKANGKQRPLGMGACEGRLAQPALKRVLEAVYEPKFRGHMFGFRPGIGCHDALKELNRPFEKGNANYAVGADIKGFFNNMERERMLELIKFRITDPSILWLAEKTPAAGIMENGSRHAATKGPEQGNPASPAVASICMHYALAQWFGIAFKKQCRGECGLALCAGDFAAAFQYKGDAYYFPPASAERFALFGLEPGQAKTRLAEFGKYAGKNRKTRGRKKPETFDFLGSARCCSKSRVGRFRAERKTARKKFQLKLKELNLRLKQNRRLRLKDLFGAINLKLKGRCQYCGTAGNYESLSDYPHYVKAMLYKWLNRRSEKKSCAWEGFQELLKAFPLARPHIYCNIYS